MRVIHKAEITSEELRSYIGKEENRELNLTKELKSIIENRENNEKGKE